MDCFITIADWIIFSSMTVIYFETLRRLAPTAEKENRDIQLEWVCFLRY